MAQFQPTQTIKSNHGVLLGGTAGFAVGGPLGALIGTAVGFGYDRYRRALSAVEAAYEAAMEAEQQQADPRSDRLRAQEAAFQIGIIALGAKLARLNRRLDRSTIESFRTAFRLPPSDIPLIKKMFEQALFDSVGHKPYAEQLANIFAAKHGTLEQLLVGLVRFAGAEPGGLTPAVVDYLENLSYIFGLPRGTLDKIFAQVNITPTVEIMLQPTPFEVLGVAKNAPEIVIKQAYRTLVKDCHPDRVLGQGNDPVEMAAANDRVASLNAAYAEIKKSRGWN